MESVRADHTSLNGYERETTPNLRRIADLPDGESFDRCFSTGRWTPPSTASILTGTHPTTHTVGLHYPLVNTLPESIETLPGLLGDGEYDSFGLGGSAYIASGTELDRDFDQFLDLHAKNLPSSVGIRGILSYLANVSNYGPGLTLDRLRHKMAYMMLYRAKRLIRTHVASENPFFMYMHINDSHYPYTPPKPFLEPFADEIGLTPEHIVSTSLDIFDDIYENVADGLPLSQDELDAIVAAYDAEIAHVDHFIGELFDFVRSTVAEDTIFVVTSDHGEVLGEYGWLGHHLLCANELFHVPLVVHGLPEIHHQTGDILQHIDLTRTIAELNGAASDQFEGVDLTADRREYAVGQRAAQNPDKLLDLNPEYDIDRFRFDPVNCIWDGEFKLVVGEDGDELFELPDETANVIDEHPEVARELRSELAERLPKLPKTNRRDPAEFDDVAMDRLRDMGYIQ